MVTAELAVCLPVLVLLLAVALGAVSVASARIRVADVAREAARLAARGDSAGVGGLEAREAPAIHIGIARFSNQVTATASAKVGMLWQFAVRGDGDGYLGCRTRARGQPAMSDDRGSASIWVLATALVVLAFGYAVTLRGLAVLARHRADAAADLAALAAAGPDRRRG